MKKSIHTDLKSKLHELENVIRNFNAMGNKQERVHSQNHPDTLLSHIQNLRLEILKDFNDHIHHKLSVREIEIVMLIAQGKTTEEIAKIQNLSKHTVESHRANIYSKLDVRNVAELVALAFRLGLVV